MTDRTLDQHLTQWVARHALSDAQADAIRRAILTAPPITTDPLPAAWWNHFSATLTLTFQKSAPTFRAFPIAS